MRSIQELEEIARLAGYSGATILGEMHAFRSKEAREDDIKEGLSPLQVILDQAAHLMDAVAIGEDSLCWFSFSPLPLDRNNTRGLGS